ncbi:E3 ubiquitin-protein ligase TRIM35-like isoform X1 [Lates calcarifer]|uniref:E3 ubiquitin-protein ligase TRIM35-like isoform X1 n=1 Tax=Lates calcarifer TaxID=8187 RepID=A0AAJ8DX42_LATCA|nr:E3 ubiquitin-protein ligase TRIM35-like isoform X1 [Lates calcarifer]
MMASRSVENLHCPVCNEIFQDPVLLSCGHSFCRACWHQCWTRGAFNCPVCKARSSLYNPPQNLALRNPCKNILREKTRRSSAGSAALCSLHSEELKLFCLDHQQPVCVVCLHSETHKNHSFRPIDEAAWDYRAILRELLKPLQEKLKLFIDIKGNSDQKEKYIEVQAQDTEKQIKDVFSMLQTFLQNEEQRRIAALRMEKQQKTQMIKNKSEALRREIQTLSDTVRATEKVLRAEDVSFLQRYKTAAETVQYFPLNDLQPTPGVQIDMDKHLNNLHFNILDRMKMEVTNTLGPQTADPEPIVTALGHSLASNLRLDGSGGISYPTPSTEIIQYTHNHIEMQTMSNPSIQPAQPLSVSPIQPAQPFSVSPIQAVQPLSVSPIQPAQPFSVSPIQPAQPFSVSQIQAVQPLSVSPFRQTTIHTQLTCMSLDCGRKPETQREPMQAQGAHRKGPRIRVQTRNPLSVT